LPTTKGSAWPTQPTPPASSYRAGDDAVVVGDAAVEVLLGTEVKALEGDRHLEWVVVEQNETGERRTLTAGALVVLIGAAAHQDGRPRCRRWRHGRPLRRRIPHADPELNAIGPFQTEQRLDCVEVAAKGEHVADDQLRVGVVERHAEALAEQSEIESSIGSSITKTTVSGSGRGVGLEGKVL
jgi:hypothetical protein